MARKRETAAPDDSDLDTARAEIDRHRLRFWRMVDWARVTSQKAVIWIAFFALIWLLRDFFGLIFLTFVLAYVSASLARLLERPLPVLGWKTRVTLVYVGFVGLCALFGWSVVPQVKEGALRVRTVATALPERWQEEIEPKLIREHEWYSSLLRHLAAGADVEPTRGDEGGGGGAPPAGETPEATAAPAAASPPPDPPGLLTLPRVAKAIEEAEAWLLKHTPNLMSFMFDTVALAAASFMLLFLSTLFSFLITLDLRALQGEVRKLEATHLGEFYRETAANIVRFGDVLGRVIEAQAVISIANTALTVLGLWILGVPQIAFLGIVVFLCGFIPVAGVFISSIPICLVGLYTGGINLCLLLILFIIGIHFLEAYVLNPRIMGAALKVNPVLTLVILFIGHHAFGVWGMILGLPLAYYFFTHVIKRDDRKLGFALHPAKDG